MVNNFKGKKVLVMGLGLHGGAVSVVKWLVKHKAIVTITDIKNKTQLQTSLEKISKLSGAKNIKYSLGGHKLSDFVEQDLIVQNPGVPSDSKYLKQAKKNNIPIVNEAVMFFGLYAGEAIGVTGTRGKSTTATLIHKILKTTIKSNVVAGNIANNPMLEVLPKLKVKSLPVLELSSWHLDVMDDYKVSPHIAVVTNVLIDHLNRYKDFSDYKRAKGVIAKYQVKRDKLVLNYDNLASRSLVRQTKAQVYFYSLKKSLTGVYLKSNKIYFKKGKHKSLVMTTDKIKLLGKHNLSNILAAVCVAKIVGISNQNISKAINNFKGVDYRLEYKGKINGLEVYNDSTSTTPDAGLAAIQSFENKKIILIAGGQDKNLDYRKLAKTIKKKIAYTILLSGTGSDKLKKEFENIKIDENKIVFDVKNLSQALKLAWQKSQSADILLFSPAAASFNMFKNEFDRARQFDKLVYAKQTKKK